MRLSKLALIGLTFTVFGCSEESSSEEKQTASVHALNAVPGTETADVSVLDGSDYPVRALRYGSTSEAFEVPQGAHQVDLVDSSGDCDAENPPNPCTPPGIIASAMPTFEAGSSGWLLYSEQWSEGREGLWLPSEPADDAPRHGAMDVRLKVVHLMPTVGSVTVEGLAHDSLRLGFAAASSYFDEGGTGGEVRVLDDEGHELVRQTVGWELETAAWLVFLVGDGSAAAPFEVIVTPEF